MHKYLEKENEVTFDKIFNQILGFLLFKDFCENVSEEPVPQLKFYEEIKTFEKTECREKRKILAKDIYDNFIMKEMLSHTHVSMRAEKRSRKHFVSAFGKKNNFLFCVLCSVKQSHNRFFVILSSFGDLFDRRNLREFFSFLLEMRNVSMTFFGQKKFIFSQVVQNDTKIDFEQLLGKKYF